MTIPKTDVRAHVAQVLLAREIGQRIPTVQELQASTGTGTGTVVKALRNLQESGAVTLTARGHQGTIVTGRDVGQLWNAAALGNYRMILPPQGPSSSTACSTWCRPRCRRSGWPWSPTSGPA